MSYFHTVCMLSLVTSLAPLIICVYSVVELALTLLLGIQCSSSVFTQILSSGRPWHKTCVWSFLCATHHTDSVYNVLPR